MRKRPKCKQCGKALNAYRRSERVNSQAEADALVAKSTAEQQATIKDLSSLYRRPEFLVITTRGYGGYGDNLFCGLRCGYKWALAHA